MDLDSLRSKAEGLLDEHGDQNEKGLDKAAEIAEDGLGHDDQIEAGVERIKDLIPGGK